MPRGAKDAKPAKAKIEAELAAARKALTREVSRRRKADKHLAEAVEQQAATAEILRVISSSPTDFQPVFDTIVRNAARMCEAFDALLVLADGDEYVNRAHYGPIEAELGVRRPLRGTVSGRALLEARVIQVENLAEAPDYPAGRALAQRVGYRTTLSVPLLRAGAAIGAISIRRTVILPFSDKQIELLQTFADQAVIAIENVRQFTEVQQKNEALTRAHAQVTEALEQQTATSEILRVISQSPTEAQPVFETIVRNAVRLCGGEHGGVYRFDGQLVHSVAHDGFTPEELEAWRKTWPRPVTAASAACLAIRAKNLVRIADIETAPELSDLSTEARANLRERGSRSVVAVPMRRHDDVIGVIAITHRQVDGFSDAHVELLKTFADQAVIAIENVRLFTELQEKNHALTEAHAQVSEALEQQTATAEILRVISRSQTDVQPVFDTIVRSAVKLCNGLFGGLYQFDGELIHHVAHHNYSPEALEEVRRIFPARANRGRGTGRAILERAVVHIPDVELDPEYQQQAFYRAIGFRSGLWVPMLREGTPIGVIAVTRAESGPFSDNEIALLQTFADQAVIAIENVRLFKELEARNRDLTDALEQQTATAEILGVISSSPTDVQPVFDAIVRSATRLCGGRFGTVNRFDGTLMHLAAHYNIPPDAVDELHRLFPRPLDEGSFSARAMRDGRPHQNPDVQADPSAPIVSQRMSRVLDY